MAGFLAGYGYFWLFAGDAATSVLFGMVAMFALPHGVQAMQKSTGWRELLLVLRQDRRFHQLLLSNFCIALVFFQMASTFGLYVTQLGFSAATYGAIFSLNGALVVFCELPLTAITRRFPAKRVMALGYLLAGTGFALNAFAHSVPALVICMTVFTLGEMLTLPVSSAYIAELAPPHMRGRYMGMSGLTWAVALIVGPGLGMKLLSLNPIALWLSCGTIGALAAVVISAPTKKQAAPLIC
jgi:MFS family permease